MHSLVDEDHVESQAGKIFQTLVEVNLVDQDIVLQNDADRGTAKRHFAPRLGMAKVAPESTRLETVLPVPPRSEQVLVLRKWKAGCVTVEASKHRWPMPRTHELPLHVPSPSNRPPKVYDVDRNVVHGRTATNHSGSICR